MKFLLKEGEMAKIKEKVTFDYDKNRWIVPKFNAKIKDVNLPSLGGFRGEVDSRDVDDVSNSSKRNGDWQPNSAAKHSKHAQMSSGASSGMSNNATGFEYSNQSSRGQNYNSK